MHKKNRVVQGNMTGLEAELLRREAMLEAKIEEQSKEISDLKDEHG